MIIADTMLKSQTEALATFEAVGIPVYIELTSDFSRLEACLFNMASLLGEEDKANALWDYVVHYKDWWLPGSAI